MGCVFVAEDRDNKQRPVIRIMTQRVYLKDQQHSCTFTCTTTYQRHMFCLLILTTVSDCLFYRILNVFDNVISR
jgi:hypothetical protein